ncbi:MAG: 4-hydroxy-tetrahydrodipicolinate reductase, partial [Chlorobiales bacterium]|nr:4-hydroxy-tetrahydrodipicolinate reductase [Chlorobiales bacterium]
PMTKEGLKKADVVIEFTNREAFLQNLDLMLDAGVPVVVGTTGWHDDFESVKKKVLASNTPMLYAANFSLGVNIFFRLVRQAARLIAPFENFDIAITEQHHTGKQDAPSGTALKAAQEVLAGLPRKTQIKTSMPEVGRIQPNELLVTATRLGTVFGQHTIHIDSESDSIEVSHTAKNRIGLARGAVEAAIWLAGKGGKGMFSMDDFLNEKLA